MIDWRAIRTALDAHKASMEAKAIETYASTMTELLRYNGYDDFEITAQDLTDKTDALNRYKTLKFSGLLKDFSDEYMVAKWKAFMTLGGE